jgi:uncharacterized RDD family membrane protein YckC
LASSWSSSPDYAGFAPRLLAALIDWLIFFVVSAPVSILFFKGSAIMPLLGAAAVIGFWRACGATPGKLAAGIRIVDAGTGRPAPTRRLLLRLACYLLSALPLYLGFVWIAFDRRKQGWHDKIARTLVIHESD